MSALSFREKIAEKCDGLFGSGGLDGLVRVTGWPHPRQEPAPPGGQRKSVTEQRPAGGENRGKRKDRNGSCAAHDPTCSDGPTARDIVHGAIFCTLVGSAAQRATPVHRAGNILMRVECVEDDRFRAKVESHARENRQEVEKTSVANAGRPVVFTHLAGCPTQRERASSSNAAGFSGTRRERTDSSEGLSSVSLLT